MRTWLWRSKPGISAGHCIIYVRLWVCHYTLIGSKVSPTRKFALQFVTTATAVAVGRASCPKSSVTKNQGIEPGPTAKPTTNKITITIEM